MSNYFKRIACSLAVLGTIVVLQACGNTTTPTVTNDGDRYWQITPTGGSQYFIRTRTESDNKITIVDPCNPATVLGSATPSGNQSWAATISGSAYTISVDRLTLTMTGTSATGTTTQIGARIKPVTCTNGVMSGNVVLLTLQDIGEGTFATGGSGMEHLNAAIGQQLQVLVPNQTAGATTTQPKVNVPIGTIECSTTPITKTENNALTVPPFTDEQTTYVGALLQGSFIANGQFTPITIPRSGGTITLSGLRFGNPSATYSTTVDEFTYAKVLDAQTRLLASNNISGQVANFDYHSEQVYSNEDLSLAANFDAKFAKGAFKSSLNVDSTKSSNFFLVTFTQTFYNLSFPAPENAFSVFRDGIAFTDPENQIGANNPPLYVSDVQIGRTIYLLIESQYSSSDIKATLDATANLAPNASISVGSSITYKDVWSNSRVTYAVQGGSSGLALDVLNKGSDANMFEAVKTLIQSGATVSSSNPGKPIAFTARYLTNRAVAYLGSTVQFNAKDCTLLTAQGFQYTLDLRQLDDDLSLNVTNTGKAEERVHGALQPQSFNLLNYDITDGKDHDIRIELRNFGCFATGIQFVLTRSGGGQDPITKSVSWQAPTVFNSCGCTGQWIYSINQSTGKLAVVRENPGSC